MVRYYSSVCCYNGVVCVCQVPGKPPVTDLQKVKTKEQVSVLFLSSPTHIADHLVAKSVFCNMT